MPVPLSQMWAVTSYVIRKRLAGERYVPLVLMLEPLFRCNLACAGCGKIQYPAETLRRQLSPEECFRAVEECGAPIVSIPGGEPLLHPQIDEIVAGIVARRRYVYLCTNALLLEKHLHRFRPSRRLCFSVHLDGPREEHDAAVCRDGVYDVALRAIRSALDAGFRVTTNSTFFNDADPERMRQFFDRLMELGVEGMTISPGYAYEKAPDQQRFLVRERTQRLFRRMLDRPSPRWRFNQSPLFLEFLKGDWQLECTPWGNPTYNIFGWQRPCYLQQDGYCGSFRELVETTDWSRYGAASGNPKCRDCMVHSGYEPTAVLQTLGTWRGFLRTLRLMVFGPPRRRAEVDSEPQTGRAGELVPEGSAARSPAAEVALPILESR